jgi:hypothetical protein
MVKFLKDQMLQPKETAVYDEEEDDETNKFPIFIIVLVVRVLCGQSNEFGCANGADKTIPAGFNRVFPNCQILNILYKMFSPIMDRLKSLKDSGRLHMLAIDGEHLQIPTEAKEKEVIKKLIFLLLHIQGFCFGNHREIFSRAKKG